jgi:hypothetical protein
VPVSDCNSPLTTIRSGTSRAHLPVVAVVLKRVSSVCHTCQLLI